MRDEGRVASTAAPAVFVPLPRSPRAHLYLPRTYSSPHPPTHPSYLLVLVCSCCCCWCWCSCCFHCSCSCSCRLRLPLLLLCHRCSCSCWCFRCAAPPCWCWYPLPGCACLALICTHSWSFVLVWAHLSVSNTKLVYITIKKTHFNNMYYQPG